MINRPMRNDSDKTYRLDESILDDLTADDSHERPADVLARTEDIRTPDQMAQHFPYIFSMRFSEYNIKKLDDNIENIRLLTDHLNGFLDNQRIIKNYMMLKTSIVRWDNENREDVMAAGEYDDYIIYT